MPRYGFLLVTLIGREGEPARRVPRHTPRSYTLLDCVDDLVRHACVDVRFVGCGIVDVDIVKLTFRVV